jgi:phosphoglycerate dehydrogenase-like enzyme
MRRLKVLFLPMPVFTPQWQNDLVAAIGDRHDLAIYDERLPPAEQFAGVEVVIDMGGSVGTRPLYDAARSARLWQILGTGLDHVDIDYLKTKGYAVANTPGQFSSVALAECAMMFILMLSRRVFEAGANFGNSLMYEPFADELEEKILLIVGFGASGQALARRARSFGMRVRAIDVRLELTAEIEDEVRPESLGGPDTLDVELASADFISLHLHLNDQTRHLIDARRIALMKSTACVINVARGGLVEEAAMYQALLKGCLGGAGLDVFSQEPADPDLPVYQLPNVITTPHIAGVTDGTSRRRAAAAAENVDRIANGLEPLFRVDQ